MSIPPIPAVTIAERPRWSVMIPAWNAERFLAHAIESVLKAGLPPGSQIEVVDDSSTDRTAEIATSFAPRGVSYYRNEAQAGATGNFNTCLRRASGELVHLLHADDEVEPEFYPTIDAALRGSPALAAVTRAHYIDSEGMVTVTTRSEGPSGIWEDARRVLAVSNRIRPPAIVVERQAFEAVGGFRADMHHAADWEMWARLAGHGPMWFEDRVLARYRVHEGQDTTVQVRNGGNITERVLALEMIVADLPEEHRAGAMRRGLLYSAAVAGRAAVRLGGRGDWKASRAQAGAALRCLLSGVVGNPALARRGAPSVTQVDP